MRTGPKEVAVAVGLGVALALALAKLPGSPLAAAAWRYASLDPATHRLDDVLLVPPAALAVTVARTVFGVRVLGFFRPILLLLAFRAVGVAAGLALMVAMLALIVAARPIWHEERYDVRLTFLLSASGAALVAIAVLGRSAAGFAGLAAFPIIALGLTCESFVRVLRREGTRVALGRATSTAALGVAMTAAVAAAPVLPVLRAHPELLVALAGIALLLPSETAAVAPAAVAPLVREPAREGLS